MIVDPIYDNARLYRIRKETEDIKMEKKDMSVREYSSMHRHASRDLRHTQQRMAELSASDLT